MRNADLNDGSGSGCSGPIGGYGGTMRAPSRPARLLAAAAAGTLLLGVCLSGTATAADIASPSPTSSTG